MIHPADDRSARGTVCPPMRLPIRFASLVAVSAAALSISARLAPAAAEPVLESSAGGYIGTGTLGRDGCFYSPSADGPNGGIRKFTPDGGSILLVAFTGSGGANRGATPSVLTLGRDGNFYGTTQSGGNRGGGTAFRLTSEGILTTLFDFGSANEDPRKPFGGALLGLDGNVYGTTTLGGYFPAGGTLFKLSPASILSVVVDFQGGQGSPLGGDPEAPLIQGPDGQLYGPTVKWGLGVQGGATGYNGVAFRFDPASGSYDVIFNFNLFHVSYGFNINLPFVLARDGRLYGVSTSGGGSLGGCAFSLGTDGGYLYIHSFGGNFPAASVFPRIGLTETPDGNFYGTTQGEGGSNYPGTVYRIALGATFEQGYTRIATLVGAGLLSLGADGNLHGGSYRLRFGPTPTTGDATAASTSATLLGSVNPNGADTVARFEYGLSPDALTALTPAQGVNGRSAPVDLSAALSGLAPGTTYYFRARGDNANQFQPQRGRIRSFTTAGTAPVLLSVTPEAGSLRVRGRGLAGVPNVVQWSSDLVAWQALPGTVIPDPAGFIEFVDAAPKAPIRRFYRAMTTP